MKALVRAKKLKLIAGAILVLMVTGAVFWNLEPAPGPLRLTFLSATNHPQLGRIAVFQFVNQMDELVTASAGHYHQASHGGIEPEKGDYGAQLGYGNRDRFPARSTNIFQVWCPTNRGPYRFVLNCVPASKFTTNFTSSTRVRIASSVSRWLHPSFTTQGRWYGMEFAVSQPFQP